MKINKFRLIFLLQIILISNIFANGKAILKNRTKDIILNIIFKDTTGKIQNIELQPRTQKICKTHTTGKIFKDKANIAYMKVNIIYKTKKNENFIGTVKFKKNIPIYKDEDTYIYFKYNKKAKVPLIRKVKITGKDKLLEPYGKEGKSNASIKCKNNTKKEIFIKLKDSRYITKIEPFSTINICLPHHKNLIFEKNIFLTFNNLNWQWKNRYKINEDVSVKIKKNKKTNIELKTKTKNLLLRKIKFNNKIIEKFQDSIPRYISI